MDKDVEQLLDKHNCRIRVRKTGTTIFEADFAGREKITYSYDMKNHQLNLNNVTWPMPYYALGTYIYFDIRRRSRKYAKLGDHIQYFDDDGDPHKNITDIIKEPVDPKEQELEKKLMKLVDYGKDSGLNDLEAAEQLDILTGYQLVRSVI